jgi:peptidylprolyl isomerase
MRSRLSISACALALAAAVAACGSSKAPGVQLAPSAGATSTTVSIPKPPPQLSTKPVVTVPKRPAPNHLVVKDLIKGTGQPLASPTSGVTVNYVGVLYKTGKEFDSSWQRGQPATFPSLSGLIKGWAQGMTGMRVGGRRELIIPASLGYGPKGSPPTIPPNSPLVFVVDLISVH